MHYTQVVSAEDAAGARTQWLQQLQKDVGDSSQLAVQLGEKEYCGDMKKAIEKQGNNLKTAYAQFDALKPADAGFHKAFASLCEKYRPVVLEYKALARKAAALCRVSCVDEDASKSRKGKK